MADHCDRTMSGLHVYDIRDGKTLWPVVACLCGREPSEEDVEESEVLQEMSEEVAAQRVTVLPVPILYGPDYQPMGPR